MTAIDREAAKRLFYDAEGYLREDVNTAIREAVRTMPPNIDARGWIGGVQIVNALLALVPEPAEAPGCYAEDCRHRHWRSGSMPTHMRGADCPEPAEDEARPSPATVVAVADAAGKFVREKHPEWHDVGVGIVQGSHYRSGFEAGARWAAESFTFPAPVVTEETVETVEQLDALPEGTVILDRCGDVWQYRGGLWCSYETSRHGSERTFRKFWPLRVLYRPAALTPEAGQ